jgi:hypothetical protein
MAPDNYLRISTTSYQEMMQHLKENRKIQAIKIVRGSAGCGLKDAKHAVDRLYHEKFNNTRSYSPEAKRLITGPQVVSVTLDYGDGPIELDIEGMQMRALTELQYIGLDACADMLHLVDIFRAITDGKSIEIATDV